MKTLPYILTVALIISVALNLYQRDSAKDQQSSTFDSNRSDQDISELKAREATFKALAKSSADSLKIMRANSRVVVKAKKARNTATDQRAEVLRVPVAHLIDSIAALGAFVSAQDTSLAQKDSLIAKIEQDAFNEAKTASNEILNLHNALDQADSTIVVSETVRVNLENDLVISERKATKQKRANRFWKSVAVICGGIAVFLTVQK